MSSKPRQYSELLDVSLNVIFAFLRVSGLCFPNEAKHLLVIVSVISTGHWSR